MEKETIEFISKIIRDYRDVILVMLGVVLNEIFHYLRNAWHEKKITSVLINEINKEIIEFDHAMKDLKMALNKNRRFSELQKDLHVNHAAFQPALLKNISNIIHVLRISDRKREMLLRISQYSSIVNYFIESTINILNSPNVNNAATFYNLVAVEKDSFIKSRIDDVLKCIEEYEVIKSK